MTKWTSEPAGADARLCLLVGTRKGVWVYRTNADRERWHVEGPHFFGQIAHHAVLDPRDGRTMVVAAKTGHLGPTVFRSSDAGRTWTEAVRPPAFPKVPEGEKGRAVDHTFWLTPGHASEPNVWYAGTSPQGLFRSDDGGATWDGVEGFNANEMYTAWTGGEQDGTPDGPKLHSVIVDPRDKDHLYIGMSSGGIFESTDAGASWKPLNKGVAMDFYPGPPLEFGHDPHCVAMHPLEPDRLYHQNHCGIYKIDRPSDTWERIGEAMPKEIGDIGFPIVLHPRDPETAWVFPMDGTSVWPRTSIGGSPAAYRTRDGGASWTRQDAGLPSEQAWFTVKRQCMTADRLDPVGVYFGTTSGELWMSTDEGDRWSLLAMSLPHVYSVESGELE
jgi:photosystem II stability/assembly factor-like uncharacterized protein